MSDCGRGPDNECLSGCDIERGSSRDFEKALAFIGFFVTPAAFCFLAFSVCKMFLVCVHYIVDLEIPRHTN